MPFSHNKFWASLFGFFQLFFAPPKLILWFIHRLWLINECAPFFPCYATFRKQCFTTDFFKGCLEALQLQDEVNAIKSYIKLVNGADPNISNWAVCPVAMLKRFLSDLGTIPTPSNDLFPSPRNTTEPTCSRPNQNSPKHTHRWWKKRRTRNPLPEGDFLSMMKKAKQEERDERTNGLK